MLTCYVCRPSCWRAIRTDGLPKLSSTLLGHPALFSGQRCGARTSSQQRCASTDVMVASKSLPTRTAEPNDSGGGSKGRITDISKADLEKELQYLPDPLKLASNTLNLLRQDDHIKALAVVRYASSKMPCTVSWNHIIDYNMSKGRVTPAMRTYNEVRGAPTIGSESEADISLDEETRTASRCIHLHDTSSWPRSQSSLPSISSPSSLSLQLYVC